MRLIGKYATILAGSVFLFAPFSAYAILGIGVHGGVDLVSNIDAVDPPQDLTISSLDTVINQMDAAIQAVVPTFNLATFLADSGIYPPNFERTAVSDLICVGGKFYIDALPFIDLEAALNIVGKDYDFKARYLNPVKMQQVLLNVTPAIGDSLMACRDSIASPFAYGRLHLDITIRKTLVKLPPMLKLLRLYVGIGPSVYWATPLVTPELFDKTFNSIDVTGMADPTAFGNALVDQLLEEVKSQEIKVGGHLMFGLTIKPPVIPFAIYADAKYNFGHGVTEGAPSQSFLAYAGLALAF